MEVFLINEFEDLLGELAVNPLWVDFKTDALSEFLQFIKVSFGRDFDIDLGIDRIVEVDLFPFTTKIMNAAVVVVTECEPNTSRAAF